MSVHNMMRPARWRTYPDRALADVDEYRLQVVLKAFRGMGATDDQIEEDERRFRIDAQYYSTTSGLKEWRTGILKDTKDANCASRVKSVGAWRADALWH